MKLWIMNVYTKTKAMLKFGSLETLYVDARSKKQFKLSHCRYMSKLGLLISSRSLYPSDFKGTVGHKATQRALPVIAFCLSLR